MDNKNASAVIQMFCAADKLHKRICEAKFADLGVHRSQHRILMYLAENKDYFPSQKEIAERFDISPAAVAVALKKLEKDGYVKKTVYHKDNRVNNVALTEKAMQIVRNTMECTKEIESLIFEGFTDAEIEQFSNMLGKMQNTIKKSFINQTRSEPDFEKMARLC